MALNKEWNVRVRHWLDELERHFYTPLEEVGFSYFVTFDALSLTAARERACAPASVGLRWGEKWEYGWFRARLTLPQTVRGERVVLCPCVGGEALCFLQGKACGAVDLQHREILLSSNAQGGEVFDIDLESYAGHGAREENCGPCPPEREPISPTPKAQAEVGVSTFGVWNEAAYQLWIDATALYSLYTAIDVRSLRAQRIARGLCDFTLAVDFEQPAAERHADFLRAREILRPLLACVNGSTAPLLHVFGQSHLDLAWQWPLAETRRKCARTLSNQLALLEEYPEYRFLLCEPPIMEMTKQDYPELYSRVREQVAAGRMMPEGGVWVEGDTNLPNAESLVRQFVYGKRWFRAEYGVDTRMVWLPDVFGFSGALPQIMRKCGMRYFATQKIVRAYYDVDPFPYNLFMWEGIDGTQILTHMFKKNNARIEPALLIERWERDRMQQDDISAFFFPFGFGDGGGGPVRDQVEMTRRIQDLEGAPRTIIAHPLELFEEAERNGVQNRYVGELYFQAHRGTYTAQAKTKRGNRFAENALREADFWCAAAGLRENGAHLERLWKLLLFNQFHDVLPGTSIERVHAEAEQDFASICVQADALAQLARETLMREAPGISVMNSLSWERDTLVPLPQGVTGVRAGQTPLAVQEIEGTLYTRTHIPACGGVWLEPCAPAPATAWTRAGLDFLENEYLRVEIDAFGALRSIYDKEAKEELAAAPCNVFRMYQDVTGHYDAWDIDSMYTAQPVPLETPAEKHVLYCGPLAACVRVQRQLHTSVLVQDMVLESGSRCVEFRTRIDWNERHKLLKVAFPTALRTENALHEIQFGHVERPAHRSRAYDRDRYEVCNHRWTALAQARRGCAVLNDCKYGVSVEQGCIALTLLKASLVPDAHADQGEQTFTYAFYAYHDAAFADSGVIQRAWELNCPISTAPGAIEQYETMLHISHPGIILQTLKLSDDGAGDWVIRLYESEGTQSHSTITCAYPFQSAEETDMLEENGAILDVSERAFSLHFSPFEVKTVKLKGPQK